MQGTKETEELLKNIEAVVSGEKVSAESPKRKNKSLECFNFENIKIKSVLTSLSLLQSSRQQSCKVADEFIHVFFVYKQ